MGVKDFLYRATISIIEFALGLCLLVVVIVGGAFVSISLPYLIEEYAWQVISAAFGIDILIRVVVSYVQSEKLRKAEYRGIASKYGQYYRVVCRRQKFDEYKLIPVRVKGDKEKGIVRYNSMDPEYISGKRILHMLSKEYEICKEGEINSIAEE